MDLRELGGNKEADIQMQQDSDNNSNKEHRVIEKLEMQHTN